MNSITTQKEPLNVKEMFAQIKEHNRLANDGVMHMIEAGKILSMLKSRLPHGQFIKMATEETGLSRSTISRYMQMAANAPRVKHLKSGRDAMVAIAELSSEFKTTKSEVKPTSIIKDKTQSSPSKTSMPMGATVMDAEIVEPPTEKESPRLAEPEAVTEDGTKNIPDDLDDEPEAIVVDGTKFDSALKGTLALFAKKEKSEPSCWSMAQDFIATLKPLTAWQERQALCDVRDACNRRLEELDKLNVKEKPCL